MKHSARAARTERRQKRLKAGAALSLTSLMDIFTILVFFLLVNSQNPAKLPDTSVLQLPVSKAEKEPKENLVVMVTSKDILVQGVKVASVADAQALQGNLIPALSEELKYRASQVAATRNEDGVVERDITILGDKGTPYSVLRKVMATCSDSDYSKISFAVIKGGKSS